MSKQNRKQKKNHVTIKQRLKKLSKRSKIILAIIITTLIIVFSYYLFFIASDTVKYLTLAALLFVTVIFINIYNHKHKSYTSWYG